MRRRIIHSQTRRRLTPADWVPVAAAIGEDANQRITEGIRDGRTEAAQAVYSDVARAARREYDAAVTAARLLPDAAARAEAVRAAAEVHSERVAAAQSVFAGKRAAAEAAATRALADLSVQVGPDAAKGIAPAYYREDRRELVIDASVALPGVDPASVRWRDRRWRLEHLRAAGLAEHELGHAAHTPRESTREWAAAGGEAAALGRMLEESRMEASHLRAGGDREALAGVAHELILREFPGVTGDRFRDALQASLILGRDELHGGSLDSDAVRPFRDAYRAVHGEEWVEAVDELLGESTAVEDEDAPKAAELRELVKRWRDRLGAGDGEDGDAGSAPGASEGGEEGEEGSGEKGEGSGSGDSSGAGEADTDGEESDDSGAAGGGDQEADDTDGEEAAGSGSGGEEEDTDGDTDGAASSGDGEAGADPGAADEDDELGELPDLRGMLEEAAQTAASDAEQKAAELKEEEQKAEDRAVESVTHGFSPGHGRHAQTDEQSVTVEDAALRSRLVRELRRLQLPEVARAHVASELPPGRLRGRGAVLRSAQASQGLVPTARPFRATRKTVTKAPPPVVGIMLDVSGSMRVAARPVAELGWALAEAGRAIQARTALATFGDRGRLVDHKARTVTVTDCGGSFECFSEGFAVLDQRLHLTAPGRGARLLVVVTDGYLVKDEEAEAAQAVTRWLERHGVAVVWAAIGVEWHGARVGLDSGAVVHVPAGAGDPVGPIIAAIEAAVLRARIEVGR